MKHRISINILLYGKGCINMFHHIEKLIGKSNYHQTDVEFSAQYSEGIVSYDMQADFLEKDTLAW